MNKDLIRITKDLSFREMETKKPEEVYKIQVTDWIIEPSKYLASLKAKDTNHGMALLAIQLMFFEPHGQFLSGKNSDKQVEKIFSLAFNRFIDFMKNRNTIEIVENVDISKLFYKFARCGLFHSSILGTEILISAVPIENKVFYKNPIIKGWLVDPWIMLNELEIYLDTYLSELKVDSQLLQNFNITYKRLFESYLYTIKQNK